jgi:protocatechuate 3,4-dioxygenase beta subunit
MKKSEDSSWIFRNLSDLSRRDALKMFGSVGAALLIGGNFARSTDQNPKGTCVLTPQITEGPYFVEERLNRSNLVDGQPGLPLKLAIHVYDAAACKAVSGIQIDLWHASASGIYSDIPGSGSGGQTFLRGYQVTDANGLASFQTIYPGCYAGRTTHIHLKARLFKGSGAEILESTTQLFFDDHITDSVYAAHAAYKSNGSRRIKNESDGIYDRSLLVKLDGSPTNGYSGAISIGIAANT